MADSVMEAKNDNLSPMAESWSIVEAAKWVQVTVDEETACILREERVDGEVLLSISEADMEKLGLKFGARRKLRLRLDALKKPAPSETAPRETAPELRHDLSVLTDMGFQEHQVAEALQIANGKMQEAVSILVSRTPRPLVEQQQFASSRDATQAANSASAATKCASSSSSMWRPPLQSSAPCPGIPASSKQADVGNETWQYPSPKRQRLNANGESLKLRDPPAITDKTECIELFEAQFTVECSFARQKLAEYTAPRKEKLPSNRRPEVKINPCPTYSGVLDGSAASDELEATLGVRYDAFCASLEHTAPQLSNWQAMPPSQKIANDDRLVCDFKAAMDAAANINAVNLTRFVAMGTQKMHQEVLATGKPWLDANAPYMNSSPDDFRWKSKVRWACRNPICQAKTTGGWYYNHMDARHKGGPVACHENVCGHPPDFVLFANDASTKLPMRMKYKHAKQKWRDGTSSLCHIKIEAALPSLLELSDFAAYWPPVRQRAHWRMFSRPVSNAPEVEPVRFGKYALGATKSKAAPMALGVDDVSNIGKVKPLVIPSSSTTLPAARPALEVPLKPEQLRALAWMLKREARPEQNMQSYLSTHMIERRFAGSDLCLQLRVEREYSNSCGGVLAHQMGFGKTALIIALIAQSKMTRESNPLAAGTLIITPGCSALHHQWQMEIKKFLGDDQGGLSVLAISSMYDLNSAAINDLQKADVVIVNGDFFLADSYRKEFDSAFDIRKSERGYEALRYAKMRLRTSAEGPVGCFLEQFEWGRVVFDEFHKLVNESGTGLQAWRALHELQSSSRWGLTGTPDVTTALGVSEMAALLHVFVPPDSRLEAQRFLDVWVRADTWNTQEIQVVSHMTEVIPSAAERALYHASKRMLEAQGASGEFESQTKLLQLCSHFSPEELANVGNCDAAIKRAWQEQKRVVEDQRQVVQAKKDAIAMMITTEQQRRAKESLDAASNRLHLVESALSYFMNTLSFLERVQRGEERSLECPVCLESFDCAAELSVTKCGHVFCSGCLKDIWQQGGRQAPCPTCRQMLCPIKDHDEIGTLSFQVKDSHVEPSISRYGTKIGQIIEQLRVIHSSEERVLIFVQWRQLLVKIASALEEANIPTLYLKGGVTEQQRTISKFTSSAQFRTLLLAMEDDDSGLNLTCANHAFFVHPMDVQNHQVALACERQALGRIRRRGQERDVHLYRFVTKGTVEETLAEQFQQEMMADPATNSS